MLNFIAKERTSKRISKCIAAFNYFNKTLLILLATICSVSGASFVNIIVAPVGITSASLSLAFSVSERIAKRALATMSKKKNQK